MRLGGRTVLLTGATGGLGGAIARELAARGARLVLTGRRMDALAALADELGARAIVSDLADPEAPDALLEEAGAVDVLVANAALPASGQLESFSVEQLDRALTVNLRAPMLLARRLAPAMATRGDGHLLFMSSLSGKVAAPGTPVYAATKFGLRGFALALREDLRAAGVGVSVLSPGFVRDAGMYADAGVRLPPWVGTVTPARVGRATADAIERNRAEVVVAPLSLRLGAAAAGVMPEAAAAVQRRLGGHRIARSFARGQQSKR